MRRRVVSSLFILISLAALILELSQPAASNAQQTTTTTSLTGTFAVRNTIMVQTNGTASWTSVFTQGGPDYALNKEAYDSLGDAAYKDAWATTLNATCRWSLDRRTMQVTFPSVSSMQVTFKITNFGVLQGARMTIDLACLHNAGFAFRGASSDKRNFDFVAAQFCGLFDSCTGPYAMSITLPSGVTGSFDESKFQIQFETGPIPGFPWESIIAGFGIGFALLAILARRRRQH